MADPEDLRFQATPRDGWRPGADDPGPDFESIERQIDDVYRQLAHVTLARAGAIAEFSRGVKEDVRKLLADDCDPALIRGYMLPKLRDRLAEVEMDEDNRATILDAMTRAVDEVLGPAGEGG